MAVSRAPLAEIERFRQRMGWQFRWVSSHGSDFNHDFGVSFTPEEQAKGEVYYNYGMRPFPAEEAPGISVFYKDDAGEVFHTYSTYGRGVEVMMGTYNMLDLTPKGRDEHDAGLHDGVGAPPRPLRAGTAREAGACGQFVLPCPRLKGERAEPAHTQQTSCAGGSEPPGFPLRFRQLCFHLSGLGMLALRSARIEAVAGTLLNTEVLICNLGKEKSIYLRN